LVTNMNVMHLKKYGDMIFKMVFDLVCRRKETRITCKPYTT
jgi:hypothetical protein